MTDQAENFYVQKKDYWLKFLRRFADNKKVEKLVLRKYFEPAEIPELRQKLYQEFENLLPQVPDFGRRVINQFSIDMMKSTQSVAFYRVLKAMGYDTRTIGQIMFEIAEVYYSSVGPFARLYIRMRASIPYFQRKMRDLITEHQHSVDPEDYHCEYVEGDQKNLLFGLNYTNCAASHLLKKLDALEIYPYMCLCDYPMMRAFNIGFNRDQNIAIGGSMCTFRIYRDYPTPRGWPPEEVPEYRDFTFSH